MIYLTLSVFANRDREHQIRRIEEARQRREKEHGRNYVLKAYLSSLNSDTAGGPDADGAGGLNSDSGVHEGGSSPDGDAGGCSSSASNGQAAHEKHATQALAAPTTTTTTTDVDSGNGGCGSGATKKATKKSATNAKLSSTSTTLFPLGRRLRPKSKRESELLWHHRNHKQKIVAAQQHGTKLASGTIADIAGDAESSVTDGGLEDHIEWLEKIIVINKQLQREEELIVRLNAKLSKCVHNDPSLSLQQLNAAIGTVNSSLEYSTAETDRIQREVDITHAMLTAKQEAIDRLAWELQMLDAETIVPVVPETTIASGTVSLVAVDAGDLGFMQMGTLV